MELFKYCHPARIDVLENKSIRFSSPIALNDPFELKPHIAEFASEKYIDEAIDEHIQNILNEIPLEQRGRIPKESLDHLINQQVQKAREQILEKSNELLPTVRNAISSTFEKAIGILCLTESPDNLLMWAHYADSHRGFVIEFDATSTYFDQRLSEKDDLRHIRKVTYCKKRPSLTLLDIESFSPFITKGIQWRYEKEWRMMLPLSYANKVLGENAEAIHLFKFPAKAIQSLILGSRISHDLKDRIINLLTTDTEYSHIKVYQSEIDEVKFSLNFNEINLAKKLN